MFEAVGARKKGAALATPLKYNF